MWWCWTAWSAVVLNEAMIDPVGSDAGSEWVELFGTGPCTSVAEWRIQSALSTYDEGIELPDVVLCAGDRLWVGDPSSGATFEAARNLRLGNASSSGDGLRLVDALGAVRDVWVYGPNNADGLANEVGEAADPVPAPESGHSLGRRLDGFDTNHSSDLTTYSLPTPGSRNQSPGCDSAADVGLLITELMADPEGPDAGFEWIELMVTAGAADLSGYRIRAGGASLRDVASIPTGTLRPIGTPIVVGPSSGDLEVDLWFGNGSGGDRVEVVDCYGGLADSLVYGDDNEDGWSWGEEGVAIPVPLPPVGRSLARWRLEDTDRAVDFIDQQPNPGVFVEENPSRCQADPGSVSLSEVHPTEGWVELYNEGPDPVDLTSWSVAGVSLEGGVAVDAYRVVDLTVVPEWIDLVDCDGTQVEGRFVPAVPPGSSWSFDRAGGYVSVGTRGRVNEVVPVTPSIPRGCSSDQPDLPEPSWVVFVLVGVVRRR